MNTRDRRSRHTFWIDDRIVDEYAPVMARYRSGAAALAVYMVLARRADREGESWPRLELIALESGSSARTAQRAIHLLEALGLVEVAVCYEQGSNRQTSNLYTLLTPPERLPQLDPDPEKWPPPSRRTLLVRGGNRAEPVAGQIPGVELGVGAGHPRHPDTLPHVTVTPRPRQADTPPPVTQSPQEGNTREGNTRKEVSPSFVIEEVGLSNRQVWTATLGELARRNDVSRGDLEAWLRPAALIGRDGETLVIGAPNAVSRDRIVTRLLPAVREAIGATIGAPVGVAVVIEKG
jgi:Helix-turn-helix domain